MPYMTKYAIILAIVCILRQKPGTVQRYTYRIRILEDMIKKVVMDKSEKSLSGMIKRGSFYAAAFIFSTVMMAGCGKSARTSEDVMDSLATDVIAESDAAEPAALMEQDYGENGLSYKFTDDLGREVTVESADRVACLLGSFTDTWLLAGGDVIAAVDDSWDNQNLDLDESVVNLGSSMNPDIEPIIASAPDFVIASGQTKGQLELEEQLAQAGITVAYFNVSDFDEYLHMLDICTDITGRKDLYEENGLKVSEEIEEVVKRADGSAPTVLYLRASSTSVKAKGSSGSVGSEILYKLGCVNIADSDDSLLEELSMEAIIAADPDYIFVVPYGNDMDAAMQIVDEQLLKNPAWTSLTAVSNGNYYVLDKGLYHLKPNARWGEAYKGLADILYQ